MAGHKKLVFRITAKDKEATASLRRLSARFQKMMHPLDRLNRKLRANQRAVSAISGRMKLYGSRMLKTGKAAALGMTLPLTLAGAAVIRTSSSFETGMLKVRALTRASQEEFDQLNQQARKLGATTQFSAREAADGMSYLAMAGFKTKDIMGTMPGMLSLAAAAQTDLGSTADYASNILTGFGKKATEMGKISDQLTYAFTNSNSTLEELHNGLAKVGGIATKAGLSFEDMTATMMALADSGHKAETAGIAIGSGISRVIKFSMDGGENEVSKTLSDLGIKASDFLHTSGPKRAQMKITFSEFIRLLDSKKAALDHYTRIFGQDSGKYLMGLSGEFKKISAYMDGIKHKSEGLADTIAREYMSGSEGSFKMFVSALESVMLAMGDTGLLSVVSACCRSLAYLCRDFAESKNSTLHFVTTIVLLAAALGPVLIALGGLAKGFAWLLPFLPQIKSWMLIWSMLGLKVLAVTAIIGALIWGIWFLAKNWDQVTELMMQKWTSFTETIQEFFRDNPLFSWFSGEKELSVVKKVQEKQLPDVKDPKASEKAWHVLPDFLSKGFGDVFGDKEKNEKEIKDKYKDKTLQKTADFDFQTLQKDLQQSSQKPQSLDININVSDRGKESRTEIRNESRARVRLDTGKVMVGV